MRDKQGPRRKKTEAGRHATAAKRVPATLRFPCASFEQAGHKLILFPCSAKKLWDIVEINRREENKEEGYQRALSPARAERLARFIEAGNLLPTSVLVSFDEGNLADSGRTLVVPNRPNAGWVIDGQHRLAGAHKSNQDIHLPVVAFVGLSEEEQIHCFVTINREQKGVPSSLYYELLKHLPGTKDEKQVIQERATDLAHVLKADETSPFFGRIVSTTAPGPGQLSLTNFVRKVAPLLKRTGGRLAAYSDEQRAGIINNYYKALAQVFPSESQRTDSIFFRTLGFGALMNVLPIFMDLTLDRSGGFRVADAVETFRRVDYFDFASWHQRGTGNAAELAASDDLRTELMGADEKGAVIKLQ